MPRLPDRPDLDQLRRQARELLRAASDGKPCGVTRLHAVSERVTLSAAQLALAREYGFSSWSTLRAEVECRRSSWPGSSPPFQGGDWRRPLDSPEHRWSFGGDAAIETADGVLFPGALLIGFGHATLDTCLVPSAKSARGLAGLRRSPVPGLRFVPALFGRRPSHDQAPGFDDITVVDDRGAEYAVGVKEMSGTRQRPGETSGAMLVRLELEPVPRPEVGWLELRSQGGSVTRLLPSLRAAAQVGQVTPVTASAAESELLERARSLIELQLAGVGESAEDLLSQRCADALMRAAEIQRSGELDATSELPDQLARLCASLAEHRPADGLPASWSGMLDAANRTDGPAHHLDIGADLPLLDGVAAQLDSLTSGPDSWRVYLRAMPGWRSYSQDRRRKWSPVSVHAEDDLGGTYLSVFGGSTGHGDHEELTLSFLPRLDPLARALKLVFRTAAEEVAVDLILPSKAES